MTREVHLTLSLDDEQALDVVINDVLEALESGRTDELVWSWRLRDGTVVKLTARLYDTPNDPLTAGD